MMDSTKFYQEKAGLPKQASDGSHKALPKAKEEYGD